MKKYFTIIAYISVALGCFAKEAVLKLNKAECVAYALANNAELRAVENTIAAANGRLSQSGKLENPTIDADYGNDFAFKGKGAYDLRVGIKQKFPLSSRLSIESDISQIDTQLAKLEYEQARRELAKNVEILFTEVLAKRDTLKIYRENEDLIKQLYLLMKKSNESGMVNSIDLQLAQSRHQEAKIESLSASEDYESSLAALKNLIGTNSPLYLEGELTKENISTLDFSDSTLQARPDYQIFDLAQKSAKAQIALIKAKRFDDIEVGFFYSSGKEYEDGGGKSQTDLLGISVSIPLPLNSYAGSIDEQTANRKRAEALMIAKEIYIKNQIRFYKSSAQRFSKMMEIYDGDYAKINTTMLADINSAHARGEVNSDLLLRVKDSLLQSRIKRIKCLTSQIKSAIDLNYALGKIL